MCAELGGGRAQKKGKAMLRMGEGGGEGVRLFSMGRRDFSRFLEGEEPNNTLMVGEKSHRPQNQKQNKKQKQKKETF